MDIRPLRMSNLTTVPPILHGNSIGAVRREWSRPLKLLRKTMKYSYWQSNRPTALKRFFHVQISAYEHPSVNVSHGSRWMSPDEVIEAYNTKPVYLCRKNLCCKTRWGALSSFLDPERKEFQISGHWSIALRNFWVYFSADICSNAYWLMTEAIVCRLRVSNAIVKS